MQSYSKLLLLKLSKPKMSRIPNLACYSASPVFKDCILVAMVLLILATIQSKSLL